MDRRYRLEWADGLLDVTFGESATVVDIRVVHEGRLLVVREAGLAPVRPGGLDVRDEGLWLSLVHEGAGRWTVGLEAFALEVDHPDDERGTLVPLGLDVEWEEGRLIGDLLVADAVIVLDEPAGWRGGTLDRGHDP